MFTVCGLGNETKWVWLLRRLNPLMVSKLLSSAVALHDWNSTRFLVWDGIFADLTWNLYAKMC